MDLKRFVGLVRKICEGLSDIHFSVFQSPIFSASTFYDRSMTMEKNIPNVDDLIGVEEVAKRLGVPKKLIYALCQSGRIDHFKVGGSLRFHWPTVKNEFHQPVKPNKKL